METVSKRPAKRGRHFIILGVAILGFHLTSNAQEKTTTMENHRKQTVLTCQLTTPELQRRKETTIAALKNQVMEKVETDTGFKYKFNGTDQTLDLLNEFIKSERSCCNFFTFQIVVEGSSKFVWLELSGPEGAKDFVKSEMGI